ncbi:V-containing nitrogenase subunit delta [Parasulfuritortus cantonensis]|uniref:nitrogenase n=1 Tax=Parasulfuritortus cantonensis TaxID=2528202 RepID=A0A4R1BMH6_9PROT|nr:V-containing nitrogenase subunit delta [Parasulfuritortus cantonensis]TCJ18710.1 V-containing nitrogenase subunit delta [Parasulfuritortus cantonensis]
MTTEALNSKVDDLYGYVQERCLWQFFSRAWDRQENIDGVMSKAEDMLTGREPSRETPTDRLHCADALIMVHDFKERFPWIRESGPDEVRQLLDGLKERLVDLTITKSTNRELRHHLY